jgi:uncharacterized protein YqfB (UPF0267 family)
MIYFKFFQRFKRIKKIPLPLVAAITFLVLAFQNCQPGFQLDSSSTLGGGERNPPVTPTAVSRTLKFQFQNHEDMALYFDSHKVRNTDKSFYTSLSGGVLEVTQFESDVKMVSLEITGSQHRKLEQVLESSADRVSFEIDTKNLGASFSVEVSLLDQRQQVLHKERVTFQSVQRLIPTGSCENLRPQSSQINSCLFYNSPLHEKGTALSSSEFQLRGSVTPYQKMGVKLTIPAGGSLSNSHFNIYSNTNHESTRKERRSFSQESLLMVDFAQDQFLVSTELMAYYWLNKQIEVMKRDGGQFFAESKQIEVYPFDTAVKNNAFFGVLTTEGGIMSMGTMSQGQISFPIGVMADVYVHEFGHANMHYATGGRAFRDQQTCPDFRGCVRAINEGQADMHTGLMFPEDPVMGKGFMNTTVGWRERNPLSPLGSAQDYFNMSGVVQGQTVRGLIHYMGGFYYSVLWSIYTNPIMTRKDFIKIFQAHLARLNVNSNFVSARDDLIAVASNPAFGFDSRYPEIIRTAFSSRGIQ